MTERLRPAVYRPVPFSETRAEAQKRQRLNREDRARYTAEAFQKCAQCGMARINVVHESDPETAPEGPDYYAEFADELHEFEPVADR